MRVGLLGNSAQNAYCLAKFLRAWTDIEAFALYEADAGSLRLPEWEDAEWPDDTGEQIAAGAKAGNPRVFLPLAEPWERPGWAIGIDWPTTPGRLAFPAHLSSDERHTIARDVRILRHWPQVAALAKQVDLLVLVGPWAAYGALLPEHSYVAFEHGTLRSVPRQEHPAHRLLAIGYRHAAHVVITNADCERAAREIGLDPVRYSFIPHPTQTSVFTPAHVRSDAQQAMRDRLLVCPDGTRADLVFLAPARQTAGGDVGAKNTDLTYEAFARYVHDAEPARAPKAVLWALAYGDGQPAARALVERLGISHRVQWFPLQPKRSLLRYYQASDLVLDQFAPEVGSYGACTVEALSCGKPVITYVDDAAHAWCADVLPVPPVCNVGDAAGIFSALLRLATCADERWAAGQRSRQWVTRYHSAERVASLHADLYGRVLADAGRFMASRWQWTGEPLALDNGGVTNAALERMPAPAETVQVAEAAA